MKKRKPFLVRLLIWLVSIILSIALLVAVCCIYVNKKYGINLFETYAQVKKLSEPVNEDEKFKNKYSADDMAAAQTTVNERISGLITYTEADGYKISTEGLTSASDLTLDLKITDKQIAAIANTMINDNEDGVYLDFNGDKAKVELVQIQFENIDNLTGNVDINIVVKIDFSFLQEKMKDFPFNAFKSYVPKTVYISSTTTIVKGATPFEYTVESKYMTINNLTKDETENLIKTLDLVAKIGTADKLNVMVGEQFADLLIGKETTDSSKNGFAYSLKDLGAKDYTFLTQDEVNYFVIKP